ncbi:MAG TPA: L-serine ammonia-lyase [Acidobacteriaceae bacterium]|nr:L-serine ammonia-lyase [Acidobacteriaceae bacterium]
MVASLHSIQDTVARRLHSVTDIFAIGIGPSSSHTVGPMRAAREFASGFSATSGFRPTSILVELYGSLALTGMGHRTDIAILLGLSGWRPEEIEPDRIPELVHEIRTNKAILLNASLPVHFVEQEHLIFRRGEFLPAHPNGMRFTAYHCMHPLVTDQYYSIGGGAIVLEGAEAADSGMAPYEELRHPFSSAENLLAIGERCGLSIAEIMLANEAIWRDQSETIRFLDDVREGMFDCIERGCRHEGILPGGLKVRRRARALHEGLLQSTAGHDESQVMDWISLYALAVNEENAAGGRVVTAPTNGAAGVIPAVLKYYETFCAGATLEGSRTFLLTAAAIGVLYKMRASISAAEMGCQGEVGVACSMAAAGLTAALGGTNRQIENAAEIGMEHNLGLTCDPIMGLVQVPCIERNTMGAVQAVNAARLALRGDGTHIVTLDAVIETMRQTGNDMKSKYKETSLGGLAVNVVEC